MSERPTFSRKMLSASEYILALHAPEDRIAVLVRNRARGQTMQRILTAEAISSPPFLEWLVEQNESGADIFLGLNPIKTHCYSRTKEEIREIRHVYLDLDEDAARSLEAIRSSGDVPTPNFVLDTSLEKNQVVWRVDGLNPEQAESLLRSLATQFGGDMAATDISRVLRVPGFANRKYNEPFLVRAMQETEQIYRLHEFAVYEDSPDAPRHLGDGHGHTRRPPSGHRSQSEADWAYAKRALVRGDHPEEIIRKIADYRAEDKADPDYYARLTVTKASAEVIRHQSVPDHSSHAPALNSSSSPSDSRATDRGRSGM